MTKDGKYQVFCADKEKKNIKKLYEKQTIPDKNYIFNVIAFQLERTT
jgi:hypothetical protein